MRTEQAESIAYVIVPFGSIPEGCDVQVWMHLTVAEPLPSVSPRPMLVAGSDKEAVKKRICELVDGVFKADEDYRKKKGHCHG